LTSIGGGSSRVVSLPSVIIGGELEISIIGEIGEGVPVEVHLDVIIDHAWDLVHHGGDI
jgi:hypothetical protein